VTGAIEDTARPDPGERRAPDGDQAADIAASYAQLDAIEVPFLRDVAVALVVSGHDLELDVELSTIDVDADDPWVGRILGVVRAVERSVSFYAVHPQLVPAERLGQAVELAARGTDAEFDVTLEVDHGSGSFSARTSVSLGPVETGPVVLGGLLDVALTEVEAALLRYRDAIEQVAAGALSAAQAMASVRGDVEEGLQRDLAEVEDALEASPAEGW
jgi:hypothetical protein